MDRRQCEKVGIELTDIHTMTLQDAAAMLSVSVATVRNWIKAGKVRKRVTQVGRLVCERAEIIKLRQEIELGTLPRLKSRRNKRAIEGNDIPINYVNSAEYLQCADEILKILEEARLQVPVQSILFELALCLLLDKRVIHIKPLNQPRHMLQSLTELAMQDMLELGPFSELLQELWDFGKPGCLSREEYGILRKVRSLEACWIEGDDLLGLVYMSLSHLGLRKNRGSYYTPTRLVDTLVQQSMATLEEALSSKEILTARILDPCCGSGNFLIRLFLAQVQRAKASEFSLLKVQKQILEKSLHGFDIDPIAVTLAKINLALHLETQNNTEEAEEGQGSQDHLDLVLMLQLLNQHVLQKNALDDVPLASYDLVIGNPPWGYSFSDAERQIYRKRYLSAQISLESFALFIELALSLLEEGGALAFVLPEALLNVKTHRSIRELLLKRTQILQIDVLGRQFSQVFSPTITILARLSQKTTDDSPSASADAYVGLNRYINMGIASNAIEDSQICIRLEGKSHHIPQKRFLDNELYLFNVKASTQEDEIIKHMKNLPGTVYLAGNAEFAMGIVTGNNKELVRTEPRDGAELVLKGSDIFKYNCRAKDNYLVFQPENFQQVAPVSLYRAPEKLFYRFINENLVFAYDDRQRLSLNSANILIPHLQGYSIKYVLAILNSRAVQFFYKISYSSVKVLRQHIESLPIPLCDPLTQERIVRLADELIHFDGYQDKQANLSSGGNLSGHSDKHWAEAGARIDLYEQLDELIMRLYALGEKQQELIHNNLPELKYF